jgi:hypothetical protein
MGVVAVVPMGVVVEEGSPPQVEDVVVEHSNSRPILPLEMEGGADPCPFVPLPPGDRMVPGSMMTHSAYRH